MTRSRVECQRRQPASRHHGIDVDVVVRCQCELVSAPRYCAIDIDVAQPSAIGRCGDGYIASAQRRAERISAYTIDG